METEREQSEAHAEEWLAIEPEQVDFASGPLSERRAHLWALVLEARYHPCRIEQSGRSWQLLVPAGELAAAKDELRLFVEENRNWLPAAPAERPVVENTLLTLSVLFLLGSFHNLTQLDLPLFGHALPDWFDLGTADAGKILAGQWWRLLTALTLHADLFHLFGNLAIGGVVIVCLCRELGSGLAWSLLLGSGFLGNLANAWLHSSEHRSVGASTAVFGALGILAALSLVRNRHQLLRRWLLPFAAAVALLALLGTEGKQTDLGAHLFGFLFGIGLGLPAGYLLVRHGRPGRLLNALLALVSAMAVIFAWWAALTR